MQKFRNLKWAVVWAGLFICFMGLVGCNAAGLPAAGEQTPGKLATSTAVAFVPPVATATTLAAPSPPAVLPALPSDGTSDNAQPSLTPATTPNETTEPTPVGTVLALSEREHIFNEVWNTVDRNYLYPDFHGVDWNALKAKYEPLVRDATTSDEFYNALVDMVDALNDGHSRYESPTRAKEEESLESGNADYVGIGIISSPIDKSVGVVYVFPNSPAAKAGIKRRDRITALDGTPFR